MEISGDRNALFSGAFTNMFRPEVQGESMDDDPMLRRLLSGVDCVKLDDMVLS
jgi:hypothetical protein